jgi:hypothetical protein
LLQRFGISPRALFVDLYNLIVGVLDVIFEAILNSQDLVIDGEINNSIDFVVSLANFMVTEVKQVLEATTEGLAARAQLAANQPNLPGNAILKSAGEMEGTFKLVLRRKKGGLAISC